MGKQETIKIFLRIRPAANASSNYKIEKTFDQAKVSFHLDKHLHSEVVNNSIEDYSFRFTDVFDRSATQADVFDRVAKDCVLSVLKGYNSTIFAYGQTGSGKTFSITGGSESYEQRGIIPRSLSLVFDEIAKCPDVDWTVRVSYLQIYNDKGQDLLNKGEDARCLEDLPRVTVQEAEDEFIVKDLGQHRCNKVQDALNLLFLGDTNRMYCETTMNQTSSRSHCIFTISVEQVKPGSAVVTKSKLHLVDLAGSERVKKTGAEGKLLQEARFINLSLHYLQEVIHALCDKADGKRDHIPYRHSLMTMVLRDSLGGNCKTVMLATAHPQDAWMDETISTCKFAQRVASIKVDAKINEETDPNLLVKKLKAEIATLKEELAMFRKGDQAGDRVLSSDEVDKCREMVNRYIADNDPESRMVGLGGDMARILQCFEIMKEMILKAKAFGGSTGGSAGGSPQQQAVINTAKDAQASSDHIATMHSLQLQLQQKDTELNMLLNIVQKYQAKKASVAVQTGEDTSTANRPTSAADRHPTAAASVAAGNLSSAQKHEQVQMIAVEHQLAADYNLDALNNSGLELFKDTTKAFEEFRRSWRKYEQIERQKDEQRQRCDKAKALAETINKHSESIAHIKNRIQQLRAERATHGWEEPDQEEKQLFEKLDAEKAQYRSLVAALAEEKKVYEHFQLIIQRVSAKLSADFEKWWGLRKWQAGQQGVERPRSASQQLFADQQRSQQQRERSAYLSEVAQMQQAPLSLSPTKSQANTSTTSSSTATTSSSAYRSRGAAPDEEVQQELRKLFKAREALRSNGGKP